MTETLFKISTEDLEALSKILKGDSDPNSNRQFSEDARDVLAQVEHAIQNQKMYYIN